MFDSDTMAEVAEAAATARIPAAALLAVAEVESGGQTDVLIDGRREPLIRWEGHYFHMLLPEPLRARAVREKLASPRAGEIPNPSSQARRYEILRRAMAIDEAAALSSASWGIGQVMGANWRLCGYPDVQALVATARRSVAGQIEVMMRFIQGAGLADELRRLDWAAFARVYNGPAYARNRYDTRMKAAYERYVAAGAPGEGAPSPAGLRLGDKGKAVRDLQKRLNSIGYALRVDGDFGPATARAVRDFQRDRGLVVDGVAGPVTLSVLDVLTLT